MVGMLLFVTLLSQVLSLFPQGERYCYFKAINQLFCAIQTLCVTGVDLEQELI